MTTARNSLAFTVGVVGLALVSQPVIASAQTDPATDCTLRSEPGGLIRGDRVPSGCVLRPEGEPIPPSRSHRQAATMVVVPGVPILFTPRPTFVILESTLRTPDRRSARVQGSLPRVRQGNFGPLFRRFGPLFRRFGPVEPPPSFRSTAGPAQAGSEGRSGG